MKDFHVKKPGAWRWTSLSKEELEEQIEKGVIHIRVKPSAPAAEAQKVARIILENYPDARTKDSIFVNVIYGYDIGISSWFFNQGFNYSPQEWQSKSLNRRSSKPQWRKANDRLSIGARIDNDSQKPPGAPVCACLSKVSAMRPNGLAGTHRRLA